MAHWLLHSFHRCLSEHVPSHNTFKATPNKLLINLFIYFTINVMIGIALFLFTLGDDGMREGEKALLGQRIDFRSLHHALKVAK